MAKVKELGQAKIENIRAGPDEPYGIVLGLITLICVGFAIFVGTLLCFHSYLISENLTSWEMLSWMRITYLKVWPKKLGSPFTKGSKFSNCKFFCCFSFRR